MKRYLKTLFSATVFALLLMASAHRLAAQPIRVKDPDRERLDRYNKENQADRDRDTRDYLERTKNSKLGSGTQYRFEKTRQAAEDKARWEAEAEEDRKRKAAASIQAQEDAENARKEETRNKIESVAKAEAYIGSLEKRDNFLSETKRTYTGSLSLADQQDINWDAIYAWRYNLPDKQDFYLDQVANAFEKEKATGIFEPLLKLAQSGERHVDFASGAFQDLLTRFPEHRKEIEPAMLHAMAYYFGARRPGAFNQDANFYAPCFYEKATPKEQAQALQKFAALAAKYPNEAHVAAGNSRTFLNPFLLLAKANEGNEPLCGDYHLHVLQSDFREQPGKFDLAQYSSGDHIILLEKRIRPSIEYLMTHRQADLKVYSQEDWILIARKQQAPISSLRKVFLAPWMPARERFKKGAWKDPEKSLPKLEAAKKYIRDNNIHE